MAVVYDHWCYSDVAEAATAMSSDMRMRNPAVLSHDPDAVLLYFGSAVQSSNSVQMSWTRLERDPDTGSWSTSGGLSSPSYLLISCDSVGPWPAGYSEVLFPQISLDYIGSLFGLTISVFVVSWIVRYIRGVLR